uniref:Uncharacterized protein n=1 Tax=Ditylenchus dipsaci TaxID=166011 RepID=A0A915ENB2_9BILA
MGKTSASSQSKVESSQLTGIISVSSSPSSSERVQNCGEDDYEVSWTPPAQQEIATARTTRKACIGLELTDGIAGSKLEK